MRSVPVPSWMLDGGRQVFRTYGAASSALRPPPDFLVIGTKRGGTTSAYFSLLAHPHVLPLFPTARYLPKRRDGKGPHFFDTNYGRGERWYLGHFPSRMTRRSAERRLGGPVVVGEASPYYLFHPLAPARAAKLTPEAKLVAFLRDPVERTYSAWKEQRRNGVEKLSFEDALAAEPERIAGEEDRIREDPTYNSFAHEFQSYRTQSEYARSLRRWLEYFPAEQLKVVFSEDYNANAGAACDEVFAFLGIPTLGASDPLVLNSASATPMAEGVRTALEAHFAPHDAELERLLGRPLPWPRG